MKLISMVDFVLKQTKSCESVDLIDFLETRDLELSRIEKYAKFLKQRLELWMLIGEEKLFKELYEIINKQSPVTQIKKRPSGTMVINLNRPHTISDLIHYNLTLTSTAIKQIGLYA